MQQEIILICKHIRKSFIWLFTMSLFPAFVALLGTLAGWWSSLYTSEIKGAIPVFRSAGFTGEYASEAIIGIGLVIVFFLLFALQQSAKNMQEADARRDMLAETARLKSLVERLETLPPDGFLQKFQDLYREVANLPFLPWSGDVVTKEVIEDAIRSVLAAIANLAHKFDGAPDGQKHVANLMICRTQGQVAALAQDERQALENRLIFCPDLPTPKLNGLAAVLDLIPQLSSDFDKNDVNAVGTPVIALPVPQVTQVDLGPEYGIKYKVLPGAPYVAAMHRYAAFESMRTVLDWCKQGADVTLETYNEIREFFHAGPGVEIKSFIAIPICITVDCDAPQPEVFGGLSIELGNDQREDCLAVLNIHSRAEGILGGAGYGMFVPIIEPFVRILAVLLVSYDATFSTPITESATLVTQPEKNDDGKPSISEEIHSRQEPQADDSEGR